MFYWLYNVSVRGGGHQLDYQMRQEDIRITSFNQTFLLVAFGIATYNLLPAAPFKTLRTYLVYKPFRYIILDFSTSKIPKTCLDKLL